LKSLDDDDIYVDNISASLAVFSASMSTRFGASSDCDGGDGHQMLRVAGNILHKVQGTSDKGCPPVWLLGELLTSQQHNNLLLY